MRKLMLYICFFVCGCRIDGSPYGDNKYPPDRVAPIEAHRIAISEPAIDKQLNSLSQNSDMLSVEIAAILLRDSTERMRHVENNLNTIQKRIDTLPADDPSTHVFLGATSTAWSGISAILSSIAIITTTVLTYTLARSNTLERQGQNLIPLWQKFSEQVFVDNGQGFSGDYAEHMKLLTTYNTLELAAALMDNRTIKSKQLKRLSGSHFVEAVNYIKSANSSAQYQGRFNLSRRVMRYYRRWD